MLVCHCFKLTDRDILVAAKLAESHEDFTKRCKAGRGCGGCRALVKELFEGVRDEPAIILHKDKG